MQYLLYLNACIYEDLNTNLSWIFSELLQLQAQVLSVCWMLEQIHKFTICT